MEACRLRVKKSKIRGLETAWLEGGQPNGPIMLFLHGYPDGPESYDLQFSHFASDYHIVAPYLRGCLPSEKHCATDRYGHFAQALDFMEILKLADPGQKKMIVLVGHDLGAAHAWFLAPLLGTRLAALVIMNGMSVYQMADRLTAASQLIKSWYIYPMLLPKLPKIFLRRFSGQVLNFAYSQGGLKNRPDIKASLLAVVNPAEQYRALLKDYLKTRSEARKKIKAPVLVVWGKNDRFLNSPKKVEFAKDADDVTVRLLPCNHWVHREQPALVNDLLEDFLSQQGR